MIAGDPNVTYSNAPIVYMFRQVQDENGFTDVRTRRRRHLQDITSLPEVELSDIGPMTARTNENRIVRREDTRRRLQHRREYANSQAGRPHDHQVLLERLDREEDPDAFRERIREEIGKENRAPTEPMPRRERENRRERSRSRDRQLEGLGIGGMSAFCVKCRQMRPIQNIQNETLATGRKCVYGVCGTCGTKLTKFVSGKVKGQGLGRNSGRIRRGFGLSRVEEQLFGNDAYERDGNFMRNGEILGSKDAAGNYVGGDGRILGVNNDYGYTDNRTGTNQLLGYGFVKPH